MGRPTLKNKRLGQENISNQGYLMRIIEYNRADDIVVEFQDEYKEKIQARYDHFLAGEVSNPSIRNQRFNQEKNNNQGCLMKIVKYNNCEDIIIEFQDKYKMRVNTTYKNFITGSVKNPYYPSVFGVGYVGTRCPTSTNGEQSKEYKAWQRMLIRCYDKKLKEKYPTYKDVACCEAWFNYENFYTWLHSQGNFEKWLNGNRWHLDKDIIIKENKVYSPDTCCLVPQNVNTLFVKNDTVRGDLPIGVTKDGKSFRASCNNPITNVYEYLGEYSSINEAFLVYKKRKEEIIKQVAEIEYSNGNITKKCYDAMMGYEVEITD